MLRRLSGYCSCLRSFSYVQRQSAILRNHGLKGISNFYTPRYPFVNYQRRLYSSSGKENIYARFHRFFFRGRKKLSRDDIWALTSWLFVGQGLFLLIGTTTFASLLLFLANSLQFHDWLARKLTLHLAKHTGLKVLFGDTIVPNWRTGKISLRNVNIKSIPQENIGYTLYDLTIDKAEITLSLKRWLEGKGIIMSCDVKGVRGSIDRRSVDKSSSSRRRYQSQPGDFHLHHFSLCDVLIKIVNPPDISRSYDLSIINADLPRLRKRFLLYDILAANSIVGMLDGSLFSVHIPQIISTSSNSPSSSFDRFQYLNMRQFKIHSLNVDFLSTGTTIGPLNWLTRGSVDLDIFLQLPAEHKTHSDDLIDTISDKIGGVTEKILIDILRGSKKPDELTNYKSTEFENYNSRMLEFRESMFGDYFQRLKSRIQEEVLNVNDRALETPEEAVVHFMRSEPGTLIFKVDFRFHNLRAHLPWSGDESTSLIGATLMRPLVAYINEQRPFIPISCHFNIPIHSMDGSWTIYESGIVDELSKSAARSFELLISDRQKKIKRLKKVSLWSLYAIFRNLKFWMSESGLIYPVNYLNLNFNYN